MNRFQQLLPSTILTAVGLWVTWVSFTQEPAAAFLFPRIVATLFAVLAIWGLVTALLGRAGDDAKGISPQMLKNMIPGMIVGAVYIFWAAAGMRVFKAYGDTTWGYYASKGLGFYTATALTTFVLISLYDPAPHGQVGTWVKRAIITAIFVGVMYLLFSSLLNVYTPKETLF